VDNSDELLGARLDEALHTGLDTDQVDVTTLLHGSRRRARRIRTQRFATVTAAAALVLAAPVGYEVVNSQPGDVAPPAVMLPSSSGSAIARNVRPTPTATPTAASQDPATPPTPRSASTAIPDSFAFTAAELPPGFVPVPAAGNAAPAMVGGQTCGSAPLKNAQATRPVAARQWTWATKTATQTPTRTATTAPAARTVHLTVTEWAPGAAEVALQDAIGQTGFCRWNESQKEMALTGTVSGGQHWAATSTEAGQFHGRALIQIEDEIVGIEVTDPAGLAAAGRLADELAAVETTRLRR